MLNLKEKCNFLLGKFGGMKNSGVGREGGWEALKFFTESKNVCIAMNEEE